MNHSDDKFTPETVDEQIERLAQMPIQGQAHTELDARLVRTLQHIYQTSASSSQADHISLKRIKQRIDHEQHELVTHDAQKVNSEVRKDRYERNKRMNISPGITKTSRLYQGFAVIAATIIITLLLGSWVFVVSREARQKTSQGRPSTLIGSPQPAVYALSYNTLYKLNPQNGVVAWKKNLNLHSYAIMVYAKGIIYTYSMKNEILAFNAQNGATLWRMPGDQQNLSPTLSSLQVANGLVYVVRGEHITALDAKSGTLRWTLQSLNFPLHGFNTTFTVDNSTIYTVHNDTLYTINALTGQVRWHYHLNNGYFAHIQHTDAIIYTSYGNVLYALNTKDGHLLWKKAITPTQEFSNLSLVDGVIYADSNDHTVINAYVYAFNLQDGKQLWASPSGYQLATPSSPVHEGIVLTNRQLDNNGANSLAGLDARTGKQIWQACSGTCSMNVFTLANDVVYSDKAPASEHGSQLMVALDVKTGRELAHYSINSDSNVEVAHTTLYFLERFGIATTKPVPDLIGAINILNGKVLWSHTLINADMNGPNSDQLIIMP